MRSLSAKLVLYIVVASLLVTTAALGWGHITMRENLYHQMETRAASLADEIGYAFEVLVKQQDVFPIQRIVEQTATLEDVAVVAVTDREGRILAHNDPRQVGRVLGDLAIGQAMAEETRITEFSAVRLVIADPLHGETYNLQHHSDVIGVVWIEMDLTLMQARLRQQYIVLILIVVGLVGLLSSVALFTVQRLIIRRLRHVAEGLQRVESGDLGHRLTAKAGRGAEDEIGRLVTHFDRMANSLQTRTTQLAEAQAFYRALFEQNRDGLIVTDTRGLCMDANPTARALFGRTLAEMVGRPVSEFAPVEQRGEVGQKTRRAIAAGSALIETMIRSQDGHDVAVEISLSPITHQGRPAFLGAMRDVTERKRLEQLRAEFVSTVSHELRTPLASILGFTETLLNGNPGPLTEIQREFLEISQDSGKRLLGLVNDLLDVSRLESGRLSMQVERVELTELLNKLIQAVEPVAKEKGVRMALNLPGGRRIGAIRPLFVEGDRRRLEQIANNLLSNAIKFTLKDGRVTLSLRETAAGQELHGRQLSGRGMHIQVQDTGVGVPPQDLPHLFERFHRGGNVIGRSIEGAGLGLHISKGLVEAHHGHIWAESQVSSGSTFHVWLPVCQPRPAELEQDELSSSIVGKYFASGR